MFLFRINFWGPLPFRFQNTSENLEARKTCKIHESSPRKLQLKKCKVNFWKLWRVLVESRKTRKISSVKKCNFETSILSIDIWKNWHTSWKARLEMKIWLFFKHKRIVQFLGSIREVKFSFEVTDNFEKIASFLDVSILFMTVNKL